MSQSSPANNELFYSRLPVNELSLSELFMEEHLFFDVPTNWLVLITDIQGSTTAIENGLHETVNLLATGSIVAVLNIAYKHRITIPFFFGGDGATFLVPPGILDESLQALLRHRENTERNFNLQIRVGCIPVADIRTAGHRLTISKLRASKLFSIPVSLGSGIAYAEKIIKGNDYLLSPLPSIEGELDLSGMQCRWDRIRPPQQGDEVVSLLVVARKNESQAIAFKLVMDELDRIYGGLENRKPISILQLKMNGSLRKLVVEMRTRFGGMRPFYLVRNWMTTLLARFYFQTKTGKTYLDQLVQMSDTLVIDGKINTVISGSSMQRTELETSLRRLEEEGIIWFGLYVSRESVMSCYVRSITEEHIHFVDGSEGGYTRAAGMLKKKFRESKSPI